MRPFFVSYRRQPWQSEALQLSLACRRRGLRTIVDVSDPATIAGSSQLDALRRAIRHDCDGLILYFTRNIIDSPTVWNLEVPTAFDAVDNGDYILLPVFRDISPADASLLQPHGRRLAAIAGVVLQFTQDPSDEARAAYLQTAHAEVSKQALAAQLRRYGSQLADRPVEVTVRTRDSGVKEANVDLLIDWTDDFERLLGGELETEPRLTAALRDVRQALANLGARAIRFHGPAHLSAATAFGYAFNRAAGFRFEAAQRDVIWPADGPSNDHGLQVSTQQLTAAGTDVLAILAISRPEIVADADAISGELGLPIGGRVLIHPQDGPGRAAVVDDAHARGVVKVTTESLMRARADWRARGPIHLFIAAPFGLAALLGHGLNGFAPVHIYEPRPNKNGYVRVMSLS